MKNLYAHTHPDYPADPTRWQKLEEHSRNVAQKAGEFAVAFASAEWAAIAGYLHDIGKARNSFQSYLRACNGLADTNYDASDHTHSGAGAVWADQTFVSGKVGRIFAYIVAGHHAGLPDWIGGVAPQGSLSCRLENENPVIHEPSMAAWILEQRAAWMALQIKPPWSFGNANQSDVSFWIRMLYSCQVDADFLDTEVFMDSGKATIRSRYPSLRIICTFLFRFGRKATRGKRNSGQSHSR